MRAVVVYESMYGNTRRVAEAVADGIRPAADVTVVEVSAAAPELLSDADLLIVGAPTHAWGMSRPGTRKAAADGASKPGSALTFEPAPDAPGVREWLAGHPVLPTRCAVFDTRIEGPVAFSGRASRSLGRRLRRLGSRPVCPAESFVVTRQSVLVDGELERATGWGRQLSATAAHASS